MDRGVLPMSPAPRDWADCLDRVTDLLAQPVDPRAVPWTLHVAVDVRDCPETRGDATVVLARLNHILTDGGGGAALMRALFSPRPDTRDVMTAGESREATATPTRLWIAIAGLVRRSLTLPLAAVRLVRGASRAGFGSFAHPPRVVFNGPPGRQRQLAVVAVPGDLGAGSEFTKTHLVLTAISLAMQRYSERRDDTPAREMAAHVTVRVPPGHRWRGANRFLPALVSLAGDAPTVPERVRRIAAGLHRERTRLDDPRVVAFYRLVEAVPLPVMRVVSRLGRPSGDADVPVVAQTTVTSLNCGDRDLQLGGAQLRFISGFPALSSTIGLGHGLYGAGKTLTVGVLSSPASLPDPDEYASLLSDALDEVAALAG